MKIRRDEYDERFSRLSDYLDGALDACERTSVERELASDDQLRAELGVLRRVDALVKASADAVPELDWASFARDARQARAGQVMRSAGVRWRRWTTPLAAAAVLAMALTAGLLWRNGDGEQGPAGAAEMIAIVSVERNLPAREAADASLATLVQVSHAIPASALMGPPPARRTLVVSVATEVGESRNGHAEDEAGYF